MLRICFAAADTKKQEEEEELTGLESQEEMENMSQEDLNSVLDDDVDHDSFASLLEHETAGFIREDDKASAPPSTPPSVKTTPTPGKMHASTAAKVQKRIFTIKDCEHISRPAPQNVIDRIKAGTKRAVSAVHVYTRVNNGGVVYVHKGGKATFKYTLPTYVHRPTYTMKQGLMYVPHTYLCQQPIWSPCVMSLVLPLMCSPNNMFLLL